MALQSLSRLAKTSGQEAGVAVIALAGGAIAARTDGAVGTTRVTREDEIAATRTTR